ncbi:hypothetical protein QWY77_10630 [Thalassotalea ponticola]|uniref:hypothetical protein n=1 Tax=Thalassotalea ponticola TaxID=1523392 RepID=UPI0025B4D5D5|nr:hypothetical protein [Thalassotalea ponticola]MDN3653206.1 hypothetical protein [Thalassotalea ponticola]
MNFVIIALAILILLWMAWRLYQAKRYNRFIDWLHSDVQPRLCEQLKRELIAHRSPEYQNTDTHIDATLRYYSQYPVRIFDAAVERQLIGPEWFENKQNKRHAQHLLFVQAGMRQTAKSLFCQTKSAEERTQ